MPIERLRPSFSFDEERLKELKRIAPEAFADGKINWETLKDALGEHLEDESGKIEHFGLFWPGKIEARRIASMPSKGTIVPAYGEGMKAEGTLDTDGINDSHNVFIEGENLEVLKILQKSYAGRIKLIYIDPPYNTGNDFVYDDNFAEPLQEYLRRTGQIDEEGKPLTTNKKADGRFHSKWLSMIYPRLKLAFNFLKEDGAIFISIDDNEVHNLKQILNEVFGEENFVTQLVWANKEGGGGSDSNHFRIKHEYVLCYAKDISQLKISGIEISNLDRYTSTDEFVNERGPYYLQKLNQASIQYSKSLDYPILSPDGDNLFPVQGEKRACWRWSKSKLDWGIENKFIEFKKDRNNVWQVYSKQYLHVDNNGKLINRTNRPSGLIEKFSSTQASKQLEELLGPNVFSYPKPVELIKYLIGLVCEDNDYVLDFFAGSGTTGHAVWEYNSTNSKCLKFILIQFPEIIKSELNQFNNISEICKARLIRSANSLPKNNNEYAFLSYKLNKSNFRQWIDYVGVESKQLEILYNQNSDVLIEGWKYENLISEILLTEGFPVDSKIERVTNFTEVKVEKVTSDFCEHTLFICLENKLQMYIIDRLILNEKDIFICLDTAISDQDKLRLSDKGLIKTI